MDKLHPGAKWQFRFRGYYTLILAGFVIINIFFTLFNSTGGSKIGGFILAIIFYIFFVTSIAEIYAHMVYNRYFYEITKTAVKIEKGIIWKKYTSIPYEKIQNIDIKRGIIARIFNFSTVDIETAGQSGNGVSYGGFKFNMDSRGSRRNRRYQSEGHIPAVGIDDAEKIRKFVMKMIKQTSDQGL